MLIQMKRTDRDWAILKRSKIQVGIQNFHCKAVVRVAFFKIAKVSTLLYFLLNLKNFLVTSFSV